MEKEIKIKEIREIQTMGTQVFFYALGEDGIIYFIEHNPKKNKAVWKMVGNSTKLNTK